MKQKTGLVLLAAGALLAIAMNRRSTAAVSTGATRQPVTNANWQLWAQQGAGAVLQGLMGAVRETGSSQSVNNSGFDASGVPSVYGAALNTSAAKASTKWDIGLDPAAIAAFEGADISAQSILDARDAWAARPPVPQLQASIPSNSAAFFSGALAVSDYA